jgi:hypothetical protein
VLRSHNRDPVSGGAPQRRLDASALGREWYVVHRPRGVPHGYGTDGDEPLRSLAINLPAGFEEFVRQAGTPAAERTLPPPIEIDPADLDAAAARVGIHTSAHHRHPAPDPKPVGARNPLA